MHVSSLLERVGYLIPVWLSLSLHEWAHAWSAHQLGDDTAKERGRLTLNPLAHIDPIGTLLLPLLGVPFGWAKPVPIDPLRFRPNVRLQTGLLLTAAAGPLANLLTAVFCAVAVGLLRHAGASGAGVRMVQYWCSLLMIVNVVLAVFNALPVPPLDGSRVVEALVPARLWPVWRAFRRVSPLLLILLLILPQVFGFSIIEGPVRAILRLLDSFLIRPR